jgi:Polyketide cyclase / dehydrase and lipid transport
MPHRTFDRVMAIFLAAGSSVLAAERPATGDQGWQIATQTKGLAIYSRPHSGSLLKEFKGIGVIDAPTCSVHAVIDDFENYPSFMPYTKECRLIKREGTSVIGYQRLSPKICADRDYTLRVCNKSWPASDGLVFMSNWTQANELGPPEKNGVVRVKVCTGGWLLEPDGAIKTRATYSIYTDSGGFIPSFITNRASQIGISQLFEAVRKQAKNPKYAVADRT